MKGEKRRGRPRRHRAWPSGRRRRCSRGGDGKRRPGRFRYRRLARTAEIDSGHCTDCGNACMAGNLRERLATPRELMEASPRTSFPRFGRYAEYIRARHAVNEKGEQMSKNRRVKGGLADPSRLRSLDRDDGDIVQVVIETPKGSRNKYAFDPEEKVFQLKKVLPAGMTFPYDFGFIPSTKADDGDPVRCGRSGPDGRSSFPGLSLNMPASGCDRGLAGQEKEQGTQEPDSYV